MVVEEEEVEVEDPQEEEEVVVLVREGVLVKETEGSSEDGRSEACWAQEGGYQVQREVR